MPLLKSRCPGGTARRAAAVILAAVILVANFNSARAEPPDVPAIAAAADLQFALQDIAAAFQRESGRTVNLVFGSSGNFFRQIQQGAPFQMYLSADEGFVRQLATAGLTVDEGALYAIGRIVFFASRGSGLRVDPLLSDLGPALADGRVRRLAIANPAHAPYGRAAEQALRAAGLWDAVQPVLILGENAAQAAQFATSSSAQGGILPYSLALSPRIGDLGSWVLIPADRHEPLRQRMVLLRGAGPTARAFYAYLQQSAAREVLVRYGFALPGDGPG